MSDQHDDTPTFPQIAHLIMADSAVHAALDQLHAACEGQSSDLNHDDRAQDRAATLDHLIEVTARHIMDGTGLPADRLSRVEEITRTVLGELAEPTDP